MKSTFSKCLLAIQKVMLWFYLNWKCNLISFSTRITNTSVIQCFLLYYSMYCFKTETNSFHILKWYFFCYLDWTHLVLTISYIYSIWCYLKVLCNFDLNVISFRKVFSMSYLIIIIKSIIVLGQWLYRNILRISTKIHIIFIANTCHIYFQCMKYKNEIKNCFI